MKDIPIIIETDILSDEWNTFWDKLPETKGPLEPKSVLILSTVFATSSSEATQLQKMMHACNLHESQYSVIQLNDGEDIAWHQLQYHLKPKVVILLGVEPSRLGVSALFRFCEPNRYNECTWIPSLSLSELELNPDVKKQLWLHALKPVFVDKTQGEI
jgi:hypothetical protein